MHHLKFIIAITGFLFLPFLNYGQELTYSAYDKFDYRNGDYAVVGMVDGKLFNYRSTEDDYMLDVYNDSMRKIATVLLDFFPKKIYQIRFIAYSDKIIILYQALESNKVVQYAALLDRQGLLKGKPIELGHVKTGILGATKTYFSSVISENKKIFAIYSTNDNDRELVLDTKWLNDSLTIIKRSKASLKVDDKIESGELNIANDGTIYMAGYKPVGSQNYAETYAILKLNMGATKFDFFNLPLNEKFAASGYMKIDNLNNTVYFGGFYSEHKNGSFDGVIYSCFDIASKTFMNTKFIPFDQSLINNAGARHVNHAFDNYEVKQLIIKKDGGFVLISEIHFVNTRSNYTPSLGYYSFYSPPTTTMVREYHYNDIMALSYNKNGEKEWNSFIPKEQYSQEDGGVFSSYALLNAGGSLAFLYNDYNRNHSRIQLATLDADGKTDIRPFNIDGNDNPDWIPKAAKQIGSRVLVIPCLNKKQICFAKVVF